MAINKPTIALCLAPPTGLAFLLSYNGGSQEPKGSKGNGIICAPTVPKPADSFTCNQILRKKTDVSHIRSLVWLIK